MTVTPHQLLAILAECSGSDQLAGAGPEVLEAPFDDLGLDSLAVLESAARIERDFGLVIPDDDVAGLKTPAALLDRVNAELTHPAG